MSATTLSGRLGFAEIDRHLAKADELAAAGTLDLSQITQVDSAGLTLLLELTRRAQARGTALRFTNVPAQLQGLARFFKLEPLLKIEG